MNERSRHGRRQFFLSGLLVLACFCCLRPAPAAAALTIHRRAPTAGEITTLRSLIGVRVSDTDYNHQYGGNGTGLKPPNDAEWQHIAATSLLIDTAVIGGINLGDTITGCDNTKLPWFPPIGSQGCEGSCICWASAYYTKTFQEAKEHAWDLSTCTWIASTLGGHPSAPHQGHVFNPDFIYHQINNGEDSGSTYTHAMNALAIIGVSTFQTMAFTPHTPTVWPSDSAFREAPLYRSATGFEQLLVQDTNGLLALKAMLYGGELLAISVNAHEYPQMTHDSDLFTLDNYNPPTDHGNTLVGYSDTFGPYTEAGESRCGAFKACNQWGLGPWGGGGGDWNGDGCYWISYECFKQKFGHAYCFSDSANYNPRLIAVLRGQHPARKNLTFTFGLGDSITSHDTVVWSLSLAGTLPLPANDLVFDMTPLVGALAGCTRAFMKAQDAGAAASLGILTKFAVEYYQTYDSSGLRPDSIYFARDVPCSTVSGGAVSLTAPFSGDTSPPPSARNFAATALDTARITLTWDSAAGAAIAQYLLFWNGGLGTTAPATPLGNFPGSAAAYTFTTDTLTAGVEYRFLLKTQTAMGALDSGVMASITARDSPVTLAQAVIVAPAAGTRMPVGSNAVPVFVRLAGTAIEQAAVTKLTFQYAAESGAWQLCPARSGLTGNTNPWLTAAGPANAAGEYRFVWDASTLPLGNYDLRAFSTAGGQTGESIAASISLRLVAATETPTLATNVSARAISCTQLLNGMIADTLPPLSVDTNTALVFLPVGAFAHATDTTGTTLAASFRDSTAADNALPGAWQPIGYNLALTVSDGAVAPDTPITLTFFFYDADGDGLVDGTRLRVGSLRFFCYSNGRWYADSVTVAESQAASGATPGWIRGRVVHFSEFRLVGLGATVNLSGLLVGPNPFRPNDNDPANGQPYQAGMAGTGIYFANLPAAVKIEIFTITGQKVAEIATSNSTGQIQWDARNDKGREITSGFYLYLVTDLATGERRTGKLAVIR